MEIDYEEYVKKYCNKYKKHSNYDDICQETRIAIYEAIKSYDESKNTKLSTHIHNRINWRILHYFRDNNKIIKIPANLYEKYYMGDNRKELLKIYSLNDEEFNVNNVRDEKQEMIYNDIIFRTDFTNLLNNMDIVHRNIIYDLLFNNLKSVEVAKKFNMPVHMIRYIYKYFLQHYKGRLKEITVGDIK